ncbi:MAG: hypothetical protein ACM3L9_06035 [Deltaproteobacteria bacterium]
MSSVIGVAGYGEDGGAATESESHFRTIAEANAAIANLGPTPTPEQFAALVAELDQWDVEPSQQAAFVQLQLELLQALRRQVKITVELLQNEALNAPKSADGAAKLTEAARTLALFPMSTNRAVVDEANRLSARQTETAVRLDVLRRQRYNRWAIGEIEKAIKYYNENVSRLNPFNDNSALIQPMASILGRIDPIHLEPVVLELYNYPIKKMNEQFSRSEENRANFAKQLTSPSNKRRIPGEF